MLDNPHPLLNLQPVLLGRTHKSASQPEKTTLLLLRGVFSSATEPAKHGLQRSTSSILKKISAQFTNKENSQFYY